MNRSFHAVMGNPIAHSLSPWIHQQFAKQTGKALQYEKHLVKDINFEQQVIQFFKHGGRGLNITQPYKERAFKLADHKTTRCKRARAANTLWYDTQKGICADNTDGIGLLRDLEHAIDLLDSRILLVGAGGAARGLLPTLIDSNPKEIVLVNRTASKAQELSQDFLPVASCEFNELQGTFDLIINATSSSFSNESLKLPNEIIGTSTLCYDLTYHLALPTPFVAWARQQGCVARDGLGMLLEQAAEAFYVWYGVMPNAKTVLNRLRNINTLDTHCVTTRSTRHPEHSEGSPTIREMSHVIRHDVG